ncbi:COG1361 family protein [Natronobacterium texcoconense]|uniref:Uncharacterized protein n=1 Tax=Natronobacterium texcoconense TaxID=1095778 RepID=A0A1H1J2X8_NATTX|nr:hypothetical protein [Natronobacterium texcoconense]SDR44140.1 hypothetical protein SAMN04489842_4056 [Natronobacterium texcoconense]
MDAQHTTDVRTTVVRAGLVVVAVVVALALAGAVAPGVAAADDGGEDTAENETAPSYDVSFDEDVPVWIDGAGDDENATDVLRVPLNGSETTGLEPGDEINVTVTASDDDPLEATVVNGNQLAIEYDGPPDVEPGDEIELEVRTSDGEKIDGGTLPLEADIRAVDGQLAVWHPLLGGEEYDVDVEGADTTERLRPGVYGLDSLSPGDSVSITVTNSDDETVVEEDNLEYPGPFALTASVDGNTLEFQQGVAGLEVTSVVPEPVEGQNYTYAGGEIGENGQLELEIEGKDAGDELLLQTAAGVATVETSELDDGLSLPSIEELALVAPLVLSLVIGTSLGAVGSKFRAATAVNLALFAVIGLCLTAAATISVFYLNDISLDPINDFSIEHLLGGIAVLLGTIVAPATYRRFGSSPEPEEPGFTATVTITDGTRDIDEDVTVKYEHASDSSLGGKERVENGSGPVPLPERGVWKLWATDGSHSSEPVEVSHRSSSATLAITSPTTVTIVDESTTRKSKKQKTIPEATVDVVGEPDTELKQHGDGTVTVEPTEDGSSVEVEVSHEKYESRTETVRFGRNEDSTVALPSRTGRVRVTSRIDGVPNEWLSLRLVPNENEPFPDHRANDIPVEPDSNGVVEGDVLIGNYRAEIPAPDGYHEVFDDDEAPLTVTEDDTVDASVNAQFTWTLSSGKDDQAVRIDRIRQDLESLTVHSGRDTAIPAYYASVVESMLEAVESIPDSGHLFVDSDVDVDPDVLANAILETAARTTDAINDAMTTKRTIDLFAACADMPDPGVRWRGEYELEELFELFERLEAEPKEQRRELKERYNAVGERIEDARQDVSETAPAREMHQRAWELFDDTDREREAVVALYASLVVFDAVERLFEHDALRERLSRTVF